MSLSVARGVRRTWAVHAAAGLALAFACITHLAANASTPTRAYWVTRSALQSPDAAQRIVSRAATSGASTLIVALPDPEDTGGLTTAVSALFALAREHGLAIHAWVNVNLAVPAGEFPASRTHVIYQHPDWLMVPRELAPELLALDVRSPDYVGRLARWTRANSPRVNGLYLSSLSNDEALYAADELTSLLKHYEVDGVHLDAVQFPGDDFDYSRRAMQAFRAEMRRALSGADIARMNEVEQIDPFAYAEEFPDEWRRFRQSRLTGLVSRMRTVARAARPGAVVSAAIAGAPEAAQRDYLQDWRTWMDNGFVDAVTRRDGSIGSLFFDYTAVVQAMSAGRAVTDVAAGSQ